LRLQIVLDRADGKRTSHLASSLKVRGRTISEIVERFNVRGIEGLLQQPSKKPGKPPVSDAVVELTRFDGQVCA
jgi:hypothetical protein